MARRSLHRKVAATVVVGLSALFSAGRLHASPDFPVVLQRQLALERTPACTLCHSDLSGGRGTAVMPFALTLQDYGTRAGDPASLERAVERDRNDEVDSDGDTVSDIDELASNNDPNDGPGRVTLFTRPQHGCAISYRDARRPGALAGFLGAACLMLASTLRLARRHRASSWLGVRARRHTPHR